MAIFVLTTTTQPITLPLVHARGVITFLRLLDVIMKVTCVIATMYRKIQGLKRAILRPENLLKYRLIYTHISSEYFKSHMVQVPSL